MSDRQIKMKPGNPYPEIRDAAALLDEVKHLYGTGLITAEEYEAKRKQILEEL